MTDETNLITEKYKNQVLETLEKSGLLNKLRAQLKSNVYKVLETQPKIIKQNLEFDYLTPFQKQAKSKDMILAVHLIKEFLEFYEMEYTSPVFENETNIREKLQKESLIKEIGIQNYDEKQPLLLNLLFSYYYFKENFNTNQLNGINYNTLNKTNSNNNNDNNKFSSVKNQTSSNLHNEDIVEMISEIKEKTNFNVVVNSNPSEELNKSEPLRSKKLPPIHFSSAVSEGSENVSPNEKKFEKLKKFDENSPTNKLAVGFSSFGTDTNSNNFSNQNPSVNNNISVNLNETVKNTNNFNNTNVANNLISKGIDNMNDLKEDILEEIEMDSVEDVIEDNKDKKNNSGSGVFATSQTLGYDNSVTSYNLDFFDYIEEVDKL